VSIAERIIFIQRRKISFIDFCQLVIYNTLMQNVKNRKIILLIISLLLTAGLPAGIVILVSSASNGNSGGLTIGIVMTVVGFYGAPISWTQFAEICVCNRVLSAIIDRHLLSVKDISQGTALSEKTVVSKINYCMAKGYLKNYLFNNARLVPVTEKFYSFTCGSCGASFKCSERDVNPSCPYCGTLIRKK